MRNNHVCPKQRIHIMSYIQNMNDVMMIESLKDSNVFFNGGGRNAYIMFCVCYIFLCSSRFFCY